MHLGYMSASGEREVPLATSTPLQEDSVQFLSCRDFAFTSNQIRCTDNGYDPLRTCHVIQRAITALC